MIKRHKPTGIIRYSYFPEFSNWPTNIGQAFDLYTTSGMVHINKDGRIECYQEFYDLGVNEYDIGDEIELTDFV